MLEEGADTICPAGLRLQAAGYAGAAGEHAGAGPALSSHAANSSQSGDQSTSTPRGGSRARMHSLIRPALYILSLGALLFICFFSFQVGGEGGIQVPGRTTDRKTMEPWSTALLEYSLRMFGSLCSVSRQRIISQYSVVGSHRTGVSTWPWAGSGRLGQ